MSDRGLAVVTGASSGIGLELAKQFARNGFDLVVAAEDDRLADGVAELEDLGAAVLPVQTDLATFDGVERLVDAVRDTDRPLDALALNAGVGVGGEFVSTPLDD